MYSGREKDSGINIRSRNLFAPALGIGKSAKRTLNKMKLKSVFTFFHEIFQDKGIFLKVILPAFVSAFTFAVIHDGVYLVPLYIGNHRKGKC